MVTGGRGACELLCDGEKVVSRFVEEGLGCGIVLIRDENLIILVRFTEGFLVNNNFGYLRVCLETNRHIILFVYFL